MLFYPPFFKYVLYTIVFNFFVSALGVIWVPFMKDGLGASGSLILGLSAYSSILCAVVARLTGPILDRTGSRPMMAFASGLVLTSQTLWMLIAAGLLPGHTGLLIALVPVGSAGYTILGVAGTRLLMGLIPRVGQSHFFALSNVSISLTQGLMPILWGLTLDGLIRWLGAGFGFVPGWTWSPYSLLYAVAIGGTLAAQFLRHRLDEPRAMPTEEFLRILLIQSPQRLVNAVFSPLKNLLLPGGG